MTTGERMVIFCDPDLEWNRGVRATLRSRAVSVRATTSARVLLEWIDSSRPDLVVLGEFPGELTPDFLVGLLRSRRRDLPVILALPAASPFGADRLREELDVQLVLTRPASDDALLAAMAPYLGGLPAAPAKARPEVVLCVDDDPQYLSSLTRILRRRGYRVVAYESPEQAMEALPMVRPDLAILDVAMAGMSGLQMTEEIRELHRCLPIVLLSGLDSDREIERGYASGANTYLTKLSGPVAVLSAVGNLLGKSTQRCSRS